MKHSVVNINNKQKFENIKHLQSKKISFVKLL